MNKATYTLNKNGIELTASQSISVRDMFEYEIRASIKNGYDAVLEYNQKGFDTRVTLKTNGTSLSRVFGRKGLNKG